MKKTITLLSLLGLMAGNSLKAQNNNALAFDGVDDVVTVTAASSLIANASGISLTAWVYPSNPAPSFPNFDGFAGLRNNTDADFYLLQLTPTSVEARFRGANGVAYDLVTPVLTLNQWVHLAMTYDGAMLRLYKNGLKVDSIAAVDVITNSVQDLLIGNLDFQGTSYWLSGKVDEVSLWNRALSASEIYCLPSNGIDTTAATGLQLYYKCNQGTAGGNNTAVSVLYDAAGNINGALSGFSMNGNTSNFVAGASLITSIPGFKCPDVPYLWNGNSYSTPGVYLDTLINENGCDSIVQLNLSAILVDTSVTQNGSQLTANHTGIYYQWLDCNNNYAPISGATSKVYNATAVGSYAVIVQQSNCYDTSSCHVVTVIGLNDDLFSSRVKVFPTITSDVVQIDFGAVCPEVDILLTDLSGRTLISEKVRQRNQYTIDLSRMTTGAYQLQIISPSGRKTVQVVRQ